MREIIALALCVLAMPALSQTCAPVSSGPIDQMPWDEVRLTWTAPTQWAPQPGQPATNLPPNPQLTYTIYRQSGANWAPQCVTTALGASLPNQPVGIQNYRVTAGTPLGNPPNTESVPSNIASKTFAQPSQVPAPPANLTAVTVTVTVTVQP